ncbi:MAG: hypothetical protein V5B35_15220 [Candidatus Accumulibacter necessarius]|jgi:Tfp pilus assembly protein PilO|uniref:hypothetical protein n=1 Tax=Candidatus Accumulibacter necessarius TaxID=2954386 RepID=UPI002FC37D72
MNEFRLSSDRVRLAADIWLHRHGPWWLLLAVLVLVLLALALLVIPGRQAELARQQAMLGDLQARASEPLPVAAATSTSVDNYHRFRATLADEEQVLRTLQAILDAAASHQLIATRAEYLRGRDANAQADTLQMTVPVKGRYTDVRQWVEEILATQAFVAVNELGFKREDIGVNQIEAKVRLTIWYRPAGAGGGIPTGYVDP